MTVTSPTKTRTSPGTIRKRLEFLVETGVLAAFTLDEHDRGERLPAGSRWTIVTSGGVRYEFTKWEMGAWIAGEATGFWAQREGLPGPTDEDGE